MITCPYCGTNYPVFQSNCKNCGGPLPAVAVEPGAREPTASLPPIMAPPLMAAPIMAPPPAPRPISDRYAWRLVLTNGIAVAGLVFAILGAVFSLTGLGLTMGVITAFVGIPFLLMGLLFLALGGGILIWRYQLAMRVVNVLRWGEAVRGQVLDVREDTLVMVNNRHPWVIDYAFEAGGQQIKGSVATLNRPVAALQPGQPAYVLYMPDAPQYNALYPHP